MSDSILALVTSADFLVVLLSFVLLFQRTVRPLGVIMLMIQTVFGFTHWAIVTLVCIGVLIEMAKWYKLGGFLKIAIPQPEPKPPVKKPAPAPGSARRDTDYVDRPR